MNAIVGSTSLKAAQVAEWALSDMTDAQFRQKVVGILMERQAQMRATKDATTRAAMARLANPVTINGVTYNSKRNAARTLGLRPDQINRLLAKQAQ